jgi:hypothetical protein
MAAFCLVIAVGGTTAEARPQAVSSNTASVGAKAAPGAAAAPGNSASSAKTANSGTPSAQEIAAAKASGKVWANTESRVYHKSGRWYGKTKTGKFMTESEAKAAGYKEAHR